MMPQALGGGMPFSTFSGFQGGGFGGRRFGPLLSEGGGGFGDAIFGGHSGGGVAGWMRRACVEVLERLLTVGLQDEAVSVRQEMVRGLEVRGLKEKWLLGGGVPGTLSMGGIPSQTDVCLVLRYLLVPEMDR